MSQHFFVIRLAVTIAVVLSLLSVIHAEERGRARDFGVNLGVLPTGPLNAITDVTGVRVGQITLQEGDNIRTGVTAILPHGGNLFQEKVPAGVFVGNGFGKLTGSTQIAELGNLETPIVLTNTLSVAPAIEALVEYTLEQPGNESVVSVNAVVGETNDGILNDIRGRHVTKEHVLEAIKNAQPGPVAEGCVGAGTGTICFGFKGGIGTSSRVIPKKLGGYIVGVLVQTNFGGVLQVGAIPVGKKLGQYYLSDSLRDAANGSCMIVVATDAPVDACNLERMAKRAFMGLARTGGIASNGSGDYAIAFSTARENRIQSKAQDLTQTFTFLRDDALSPLFLATIEATEEAIIDSLFEATSTTGWEGHRAEALPLNKVKAMIKAASQTP
jgi:D-aminopeptidase